MITIISVGKKHEPWVLEGIERYESRLKKPFDTKWVLLPHSSFEGDKARQEESERILSRLGDDEVVILLDERGENVTSPVLSALLDKQFSWAKQVTIVIGGAYGVSGQVSDRADFIWSLSKLVFPHQLVRLILIEQLYRTQQIAVGSSYHHD